MEKLLYPLWKADSQSLEDFHRQLLGVVSDALLASGVHRLRIALNDAALAAAAPLAQQHTQAAMDAMLSLWVDSSVYRQRQEAIIKQVAGRYHGYLVTESEPLVNTLYPEVAGERTYGMCQVVFLQRPERLSYEAWLEIWHDSHTQVAIDTQSTFAYRQNVVVRKLTADAAAIDAIIEEQFPPEAMTSPQAFFDAVDDDEQLNKNISAMMESTARFIDFDKLDVIPCSDYLIKG